MESCSNPSGKIFDFEQLQTIKSNTTNTKIIIDNTWLTHVCFNPFKYAVDFIFCSTSKHYSGGNCIGGFIAGPLNFMTHVYKFKVVNGKHISLPYTEILNNNIQLMENRIITAYHKTLEIAKFMNNSDNYITINYPLLEGNKSYNLYNKYFKHGPCVFSFIINLNRHDSVEWMKSFKNITYKTSFGSKETKFDCWPVSKSKNKTQIRLAIGYESNVKDIINELQNNPPIINN